jgi:aminomethyltransferase
LRALCELDPLTLRYYRFADTKVAGHPARVARTGYTGEDGFEIYAAPEHAETVWDRLLDAGQPFGIRPCGLGARNTLRLEAAMALYGHEIDSSTTPYEAGLGWIVKLDKGDFLGRARLERQAAEGVRRKLAGFEMIGREIARDGYAVLVNGKPAGWVTSGAPSPTLAKNIGMAYLPAANALPGSEIQVLVRGKPCPARVVPLPFYKRKQ